MLSQNKNVAVVYSKLESLTRFECSVHCLHMGRYRHVGNGNSFGVVTVTGVQQLTILAFPRIICLRHFCVNTQFCNIVSSQMTMSLNSCAGNDYIIIFWSLSKLGAIILNVINTILVLFRDLTGHYMHLVSRYSLLLN